MSDEIQNQEVNNAETAAETSTAETTQRARVVFDEAQQAKVNELIREVTGRTARELRKEAAELRQKVTELQGELDRTRGESTVTKEQAQATAKENLVLSLANKLNFVRPDQVNKLAGDRIHFDEAAKKFVVKNTDGSVATGPDGQPVSIESYLAAFAGENGHMVRGEVKPGVGSTESRAWSGDPDPASELRKLFGRGSNARLANQVAQRNPLEYKRLKNEARRLGLIP